MRAREGVSLVGAGGGERLDALEPLWEREGDAGLPLPAGLRALYGGGLKLPDPVLYANFVTSLDGVAVLGTSSGSQLSGRSVADRFVMGLLRACAEAIVVGAGTLEASPGHVWTAEHVYPPAAEDYRQLRRRLGLEERPRLVLVSGSGRLPRDHRGLRQGALVLTTERGRARLGGTPGLELEPLAEVGELGAELIVSRLRALGHGRILTEGGPHLVGQLLAAGLLEQLFLTVSPVLEGSGPEGPRSGLVAGVDLAPAGSWLELLAARRHGSHLFLHYRRRVGAAGTDGEAGPTSGPGYDRKL